MAVGYDNEEQILPQIQFKLQGFVHTITSEIKQYLVIPSNMFVRINLADRSFA